MFKMLNSTQCDKSIKFSATLFIYNVSCLTSSQAFAEILETEKNESY